MANYRYVAPRQEPILMPFDQKMQLANSALDKKKNTDDLLNEKLKKIYGLDKIKDWDPIFTRAFGKLQTEVVRRLESGYYPNSAAFQEDLNRLETEWNKIDNMYRTTKEAGERYVSVMQSPQDYEDEYIEITETAEDYYDKKPQLSNFGVQEFDLDLENISLGNARFQMAGIVGDDGNPVTEFYGPLDQSPIYARTDWLTPKTAIRAFLVPEDVAEPYIVKAQKMYERGLSRTQIKDAIRKDLMAFVTDDPKRRAAVERWWTDPASEGMVSDEKDESFDPFRNFVEDVLKYIEPSIRDTSGGSGSGSSEPTRSMRDVQLALLGKQDDQFLWKIDVRNPIYNKEYAINLDGYIDVGEINEEMAAELLRADGTIDMSFIPTSFNIVGNILVLSSLATPGQKSPMLRTQPTLDFESEEDILVIRQIENVMKRLYGDEWSFDKLRKGINFKDTEMETPDVDFGTW